MNVSYEELGELIAKHRVMSFEEARQSAINILIADIDGLLSHYDNIHVTKEVHTEVERNVLAMICGRKKYSEILRECVKTGGGLYFTVLYNPDAKKKLKVAFTESYLAGFISAFAKRLQSVSLEDDFLVIPIYKSSPPAETKKLPRVKKKKA